MKDRTRNLCVGLTVLAGLVLLGTMILIFRELPGFMRVGYEVNVTFADTGGVTQGADVLLRGKRIGRVAEVAFTDGDPRKGVTVTLVIDRDVSVPGDVNFYIRGGFLGGSAVVLESDGRAPGAERIDPRTGRPLEWLPKDHVLTLRGAWKPGGGGGPIPQDLLADIRKSVASLTRLTETLNDFFSPPPPAETQPAGAATAPGTPTAPTESSPPNLRTTLARLDGALAAIQTVLGDKDNQRNLKAALAEFKNAAAATSEAMKQVRLAAAQAGQTLGEVSAATRSASGRFDRLMTRLIDDAERLGKALTCLDNVLARIDAGKGSAGKLLNDPTLYNNLVDVTAQLKVTVTGLRDLLDSWKEQGIKIQLK